MEQDFCLSFHPLNHVIHKGKYDIESIFVADGGISGRFNPQALAACAIGVAVQIPFMNTPMYAGPIPRYLDGADLSWLVGLQAVIFPGAEPNPTDINVHDGIELYQREGCDFIVSLGGGSSHDCAKGIGLVTAGGGHIRDYEGIDKSTVPMTPLISINTTAGTAAEMTRFCIITNSSNHVKMAIVDWRCTPLIAIDDPRLMVAMPPALTAATGMDALTHAVEAYVSTAATPITDACAEEGHRADRRMAAEGCRERRIDGGARCDVLCAVSRRDGVQQRVARLCARDGAPARRFLQLPARGLQCDPAAARVRVQPNCRA
ncbi:alcohol dehydrogenase [Burkholderia sp. MSMB1552]|nr:alcohol dehydrogenase [Burkholderia sp. MSMB1552]KWZ55980.1 alcohol dehydrogenase [Burkholderia sp. MSMB1588]